jgi:hypothetical protein
MCGPHWDFGLAPLGLWVGPIGTLAFQRPSAETLG